MHLDNLIESLFLKPISQGYGSRVVVIDQDQEYTYKSIFDQIVHVAHSESFQEIEPGKMIACILPDTIDAVIIFFACIYRGLIPCPLNVELPLESYATYFNHAQFYYAIAKSEFLVKMNLFFEQHNVLTLTSNNLIESRESCSIHSKVFLPIINDICFALYTSGTTGNPSLVFHRHGDPIIMNENYGHEVLGISENDIIFSTSRFYFAYGLNTLFFALLNKATLIIPDSDKSLEAILGKISKYQPTIFFSVPTMYKRLLEAMPEIFTFTQLRLCISAGENLPLPIFNAWQARTGFSIIDGIGTTEVLSTFISNRPENLRPGSTGYPVSGFLAEVRHIETDQPVEPGEIGVLWIKGETYVSFYPNNKAESAHRFVNGWFKTNDLFFVDKEGFYFYQGRSNELMKVAGMWVYPYKIERVLAAHMAVQEVIVSGIQEADGLIRVIAYIVLRDAYLPSDILTDDIKNWVKQNCSRHECPHFITYVDYIPKTPSGKSRRFLFPKVYDKELMYVT